MDMFLLRATMRGEMDLFNFVRLRRGILAGFPIVSTCQTIFSQVANIMFIWYRTTIFRHHRDKRSQSPTFLCRRALDCISKHSTQTMTLGKTTQKWPFHQALESGTVWSTLFATTAVLCLVDVNDLRFTGPVAICCYFMNCGSHVIVSLTECFEFNLRGLDICCLKVDFTWSN